MTNADNPYATIAIGVLGAIAMVQLAATSADPPVSAAPEPSEPRRSIPQDSAKEVSEAAPVRLLTWNEASTQRETDLRPVIVFVGPEDGSCRPCLQLKQTLRDVSVDAMLVYDTAERWGLAEEPTMPLAIVVRPGDPIGAQLKPIDGFPVGDAEALTQTINGWIDAQ